tara:strand:+ start:44337 stop:45692 length:1356 start_codon:yes stop_codon:yes gene_type:complete
MIASAQVLIVDDEPDICQLLSLTLSKMGIQSQTAQDVQTAKVLMAKQNFNLCLTDLRLPDGNGLDILRYIQKNSPQTAVVLITAHGNMETAILAMKQGAFDFINKPIDLTMLRNLVTDALNISANTTSEPVSEDPKQTLQLIGESDCMQALKKQIEKIARSQAPVYISGPSGAGKELVAKLIHQSSPRRNKPFIPINCGAIPVELMESEFFGHKKGSFTGAHQDKVGFFEAANQGTLFLDEIADLPQNMQVKLLRGLQEKSFRPIGATKEIQADIRFLCATHKDLNEKVKTGEFREDLFYRLNVIELKVPSLSERLSDIPLLITYFFNNNFKHHDNPPQISEQALQILQNYTFPGNIRELENILERALTLCENNSITHHDLHLPKIVGENTSIHLNIPLDDHLVNIEKEAIETALGKTNGNKTKAAKLLGMSFRTLRYRLKKLGISDDFES